VKVYFPNLNGLRFLACMVVIVTHTEMIKMVYGLPHHYTEHLKRLGHLAVISFFVLSGYLITYLLMAERKKTGDISIKNFYIRRVLRIWPLYFFTVLVGILLLPQMDFFTLPGQMPLNLSEHWGMILLFLAILPNVAVKIYNPSPVPFLGPTWSIGVEEQFYLMWPVLVKLSKNILVALLGVIIGYNMILFGAKALFGSIFATSGSIGIFIQVWENFCISTMAIGGILAWIKFNNKKAFLNFLYNPLVDAGTYILFIILVVLGVRFPIFHHEIYAFLFAVMILNLSSNPRSIVDFENRFFNYLGKISYGIYMFHILSIYMVFRLVDIWLEPLQQLMPNPEHVGLVVSVLVVLGSTAFVVLISTLTYNYLEEPLLRMKSKFSSIVTGDIAKEQKGE
jgi:peptidoglycan/LPS O-acetylase OafA/YrhL